ncbi:MAG TPA: SIS domain-containing protein [Solirubrobacteraceae bacterium]|nr:SIS domain-containing protein [Solirubrobacteraceae bacterium]
MTGAHMAAEMAEQPGVLAALAARREELTAQVRACRPDPLVGSVLVARGSSDHAATFGRYLLEPATHRPAGLAAPSLVTLYHDHVDFSGYLVIASSQSGRTPEIATVTARMRASGARTLAITNEPGSPLAHAADAVVELHAGEEQAVPATKTFTATAAAFALVAEALGDAPVDHAGWEHLPAAVEEVLADPAPAARAAEALVGASGMLVVARGDAYAMALEAALKLKETTGLLAEGYSSADLRHGPKVVVSPGFPVLVISVAGPAAADVADLVAELRGRGARVHEIADRPGAELPIPAGLPEPLAAIVAVVRAQQLALALARARGLEPDAPSGLSKVTPTT